jgi:hypothetical protein
MMCVRALFRVGLSNFVVFSRSNFFYVNNAVVAVPAYFNNSQKRRTPELSRDFLRKGYLLFFSRPTHLLSATSQQLLPDLLQVHTSLSLPILSTQPFPLSLLLSKKLASSIPDIYSVSHTRRCPCGPLLGWYRQC